MAHEMTNKRLSRWYRMPAYAALVFATIAMMAGCSQARETAQDSEDDVEQATEDVGETAEDAADNLPGVGETELETDLTGEAEVPGPGDPDGSGEADVTFDLEDGEVCYEIQVSNVATITAAHIHRGAADESGGPVVNLNVGTDGLDGCVADVDRGLLEEILNDPAGFYVNVHNADFPGGALRGQLHE